MGSKFNISSTLLLMVLVFISGAIAEDILYSPESLDGGQFIENGPYRFMMQTDCNLVLYNGNRALWSSRTNGRGTTCRATMQGDGNLVIQLGTTVVWSSGTARGPNRYHLIMQSDGNVVIYGAALWATGTNGRTARKLL